MATTTPNYGWVVPTSTDLVKDGATAIETLGDSADATVKALNPETTLGDISYRSSTANTNTRLGIGSTGQVLTVASGVPSWSTPSSGGLVFINRTSFSASASASVNDVFSSTYDNYKLVIYASGDSTRDFQLRLRVGGTDNSGASNYLWHRDSSFSSTSLDTDRTDSYWNVGVTDTVAKFPAIVELGNPFLAETTGIAAVGGRHTLTMTMTGYHNQATSYTGFTFFPNAGNLTGSVSVYGYAK